MSIQVQSQQIDANSSSGSFDFDSTVNSVLLGLTELNVVYPDSDTHDVDQLQVEVPPGSQAKSFSVTPAFALTNNDGDTIDTSNSYVNVSALTAASEDNVYLYQWNNGIDSWANPATKSAGSRVYTSQSVLSGFNLQFDSESHHLATVHASTGAVLQQATGPYTPPSLSMSGIAGMYSGTGYGASTATFGGGVIATTNLAAGQAGIVMKQVSVASTITVSDFLGSPVGPHGVLPTVSVDFSSQLGSDVIDRAVVFLQGFSALNFGGIIFGGRDNKVAGLQVGATNISPDAGGVATGVTSVSFQPVILLETDWAQYKAALAALSQEDPEFGDQNLYFGHASFVVVGVVQQQQ